MLLNSIADFEALTGPDALTSAEISLIAASRTGQPCFLGETVPTSPTDANTIRAPLLRLLILGATPACGLHERGVCVVGAWITGELDMGFCTAHGQTVLNACHFVEEPRFTSAKLQLLGLQRSHLPGLFAQGAKVEGSVYLGSISATGTVNVNGAKIGGQLDCTGAMLVGTLDEQQKHLAALNAQDLDCRQGIFLRNLTATGTVDVNGAKIGGQFDCGGANLDGGGGKALTAQGVDCGQDLSLSNVTAAGMVDVAGAKIGGQLSCVEATLNGAGAKALNAQGVNCGQDLFLRNLTATGTVDVAGAKIGGQLSCTGATLEGGGGKALTGQRMLVSEGFYFRNLKSVTGQIDLTAAHVGDLVDDSASWPKGADDLLLDGFTYDRTDGPVTLSARRDWLAVGSSLNGDFFPQPYSHFARTLRAMGHPAEARRVMIESNVQRALRDRATLRAQRSLQRQLGLFSRSQTKDTWEKLVKTLNTMPTPARDWAEALWTRFDNIHPQLTDLPNALPPLPEMTLALARRGFQNDMRSGALQCQLKRLWNKLRNGFLRWTVGFGYAPQNSIFVLLGLILGASVLAHFTWHEGSFAPNSDVILTSPGWTELAARGCVAGETPACVGNPAAVWSAVNAPGMDWDSFYAPAYAADLVVPLIDLGQTSAWAPSKDRGFLGWVMWWARWGFILAGWIVASLGLAAVTGFIQKNAPE